MSYNYETLKAIAKEMGIRVNDLLALAPKNDPFYVGTPATVERGEWFAYVFEAAGYSRFRAPHLRRVHYWTVSQSPALVMPDGKPYQNTQHCWEFLIEASKAARYLGLIPMDGIVDNKNPTPSLNAFYFDDNSPGYEVRVPQFSEIVIDLYGLNDQNIQPYHIELWCEKSTMNDVLLPVCQRYNVNLVTFEGEVSITSVCVNLMRRIAESEHKPTRIFYISDFDPAGNSMPVAMSRKLEFAVSESEFDLDVKVKPLAMTTALVAQYRLPRIPIKETETRARRFEDAFGAGAVELDALEALYPGVLARLVDEAIRPYYSRVAHNERNQRLLAMRQAVQERVNAITARYQEQIAALEEMQQELRAIDVDPMDYDMPAADPHVDEDDDWLYDAGRDYVDQIERYKAYKANADVEPVG